MLDCLVIHNVKWPNNVLIQRGLNSLVLSDLFDENEKIAIFHWKVDFNDLWWINGSLWYIFRQNRIFWTLFYYRDQCVQLRTSSLHIIVLLYDSPTEIPNFYKSFKKIIKLFWIEICCDWLKYLLKVEISVVLFFRPTVLR